MSFARLSKQNVIIKGCLFAAVLHWALMFMSNFASHRDDAEDDSIKQMLIRERKDQDKSKRHIPWATPQIKTFFEPVPGGCCGASEQAHLNLLAAWEKSWQAKGWATRILTLEDAEKHPDFQKLKQILDDLGIITEYNKRCFYRWLAMADTGGWMSDYDTFVLNFDAEVGARISKYGVFTSFESHVPSLISASKHEWERLLQLMIKELESRTKEDGFTSDMMILLDIKRKLGKKAGRFARAGTLVAPSLSEAYLSVDDSNRKVNCDKMKDMLVIHCSHASTVEAYTKGLYPIQGLETMEDAMERRSEAATIFLNDFESQCRN